MLLSRLFFLFTQGEEKNSKGNNSNKLFISKYVDDIIKGVQQPSEKIKKVKMV